ncbi:hypothetical protein AIGOOFII_3139 [Methylobacterium marchantiae]|nr:hypothetical protein AIGOOFII_3139 [Methylobacterium marchantiae]
MRYFEDQKDVDEWLDPLTYEEFWQEVSTFSVDIPSREECDSDIADGIAPEAMVLNVLKGLTRLQVIDQQNLPVRITVPWMSLH